jgi:uncharacterized protein GlcG (DUF336 family)
MDIANSKHRTNEDAKKIMATAIAKAREAGIAISAAITDAGVCRCSTDGWWSFSRYHSATTKTVCAASNKRPTSSQARKRSRSTRRKRLDSRSPTGLSAGQRSKTVILSSSIVNASGCALRSFCFENQLLIFVDHGREGTTLFGDSHVGGNAVVEHRNRDNAFRVRLLSSEKASSRKNRVLSMSSRFGSFKLSGGMWPVSQRSAHVPHMSATIKPIDYRSATLCERRHLSHAQVKYGESRSPSRTFASKAALRRQTPRGKASVSVGALGCGVVRLMACRSRAG